MKFSFIRFIYLLFISFSFAFCSNDSDIEVYKNLNSDALDIVVSYSPIETEILNLVNKYRVENKLSKINTLNIISSVASSHTNYMIENGVVSHDNFQDRVLKLQNNANAKLVGENVAYGYNSAESVVNGWLNSPEHKKLIDSTTFTHFGISTKTDKEGRNYFTQIFIKK